MLKKLTNILALSVIVLGMILPLQPAQATTIVGPNLGMVYDYLGKQRPWQYWDYDTYIRYYGNTDFDHYRSSKDTGISYTYTAQEWYYPPECQQGPAKEKFCRDNGEAVLRDVQKTATRYYSNLALVSSIANPDGRLNSEDNPASGKIVIKGKFRPAVMQVEMQCKVPPQPPYIAMGKEQWRKMVLEEKMNFVSRYATFRLDGDDGDETYRAERFYNYRNTPNMLSTHASPFTGYFIDKPYSTFAEWVTPDWDPELIGPVDPTQPQKEILDDGTLNYYYPPSETYFDYSKEKIQVKDGAFNLTEKVLAGDPVSEKTVYNQDMCGPFDYTEDYANGGQSYIGYNKNGVAADKVSNLEYEFEHEIDVSKLSNGQHTIYVQAALKGYEKYTSAYNYHPTAEKRYGHIATPLVTFWVGNTEPPAPVEVTVSSNVPDMAWRFNLPPSISDPCDSVKPCTGGTVKYTNLLAGTYQLDPRKPQKYYGYELQKNAAIMFSPTSGPVTDSSLSKWIKTAAASSCTVGSMLCIIDPGHKATFTLNIGNTLMACTLEVKTRWNGQNVSVPGANFELIGPKTFSGKFDGSNQNLTFNAPTDPSVVIPKYSLRMLSGDISVVNSGKTYDSFVESVNSSGSCQPGAKVTYTVDYKSKPIIEVK